MAITDTHIMIQSKIPEHLVFNRKRLFVGDKLTLSVGMVMDQCLELSGPALNFVCRGLNAFFYLKNGTVYDTL